MSHTHRIVCSGCDVKFCTLRYNTGPEECRVGCFGPLHRKQRKSTRPAMNCFISINWSPVPQLLKPVHSDWRRHSSPTEMMQQLKWQSLEHRRHTARLTMMYNIQHGLVDIHLSKYAQPARTHCATEHLDL